MIVFYHNFYFTMSFFVVFRTAFLLFVCAFCSESVDVTIKSNTVINPVHAFHLILFRFYFLINWYVVFHKRICTEIIAPAASGKIIFSFCFFAIDLQFGFDSIQFDLMQVYLIESVLWKPFSCVFALWWNYIVSDTSSCVFEFIFITFALF